MQTNAAAAAKLQLAKRHMSGLGAPVDYDAARALAREAVDLGDISAHTLLGQLLLGDEGTHAEAFSLFKCAADAGDVFAKRHVAACYMYGIGVTINLDSAIEWYETCASTSDSVCKCEFASSLRLRGTNDDCDRSWHWMNVSAEEGYWEAQMSVAVDLFTDGKLVEAIPFYIKSAEQNNVFAQFQLSLIYSHGGPGVPVDPLKEKIWTDRVAANIFANPEKQVSLGLSMIEDVIKLPVDTPERKRNLVKEGAVLIGKVAQTGDRFALESLKKHLGNRTVVQACCTGCGKIHTAQERLLVCGKCSVARFCGRDCIVRMWPDHKAQCRIWASGV